jgi:alpha-beta hydrolase superfamily lysophospholipase
MGEVIYTQIRQKDGHIIKLTQYVCPREPKASILILHGMAEHQKRYIEFAEYLTENGYDVYSYDHRGHGTDRKLNELGFFSSQNGYQLVVQDAISVSEYIAENNRSSRLFLLGHSMGSIISRNVIQSYDKYAGVILSGSNYPPKFMVLFGLLLSKVIKTFKGPKHISPYLDHLMFGARKYTSLSSRTVYDWLTRSNPIVGAYMHDPYCGFTCTASFYHDLLKLVQKEISKKQILQTRKDLPIFIISGDKDPVGSYGKEVNKYANTLKTLGFMNCTSKLYPDCRHEILNELNKDEVYDDIEAWISKRC